MNKRKILNGFTVMMLISSLSAFTACASSDRGGGPGRGQHGPPPEAIEACKDKKTGDTVTFKGGRGESLTATCEMVNNQLVAVPEGHKKSR